MALKNAFKDLAFLRERGRALALPGGEAGDGVMFSESCGEVQTLQRLRLPEDVVLKCGNWLLKALPILPLAEQDRQRTEWMLEEATAAWQEEREAQHRRRARALDLLREMSEGEGDRASQGR